MEYPCDAPDCERWFVMHGSRSAFGRGSVILSHTDITPQKKAEEALRQNNRRKDEFLATLAHELRNPSRRSRTACMCCGDWMATILLPGTGRAGR